MDREQLNNLSKEFKDKTNEELLEIVYLHSDEYITEVINLAKKELFNRDIDENSEKGKAIISSFIRNATSEPRQEVPLTIPPPGLTIPPEEEVERMVNECLKR